MICYQCLTVNEVPACEKLIADQVLVLKTAGIKNKISEKTQRTIDYLRTYASYNLPHHKSTRAVLLSRLDQVHCQERIRSHTRAPKRNQIIY